MAAIATTMFLTMIPSSVESVPLPCDRGAAQNVVIEI
jgi:hypothetical protein